MLETREFINIGRKANRATLNLGQPGIGKSEKVKQYALDTATETGRMFLEWNKTTMEERTELIRSPEYREKVFLFFDIRLSLYDPTDLKGLPDFLKMTIKGDMDLSVVSWIPNSQFYVMAQKETAGCCFLDEITLCPLSIQAAAYQLILDRAIGDITLSQNVFMTAAGNRPQDKTGAFALGMALRNRFQHRTEEPPTIDAWTDWAIEADVHSDIIAYLNFQPSHLMDDMQAAYKSGSNAYATPRSWAAASDMIQAYEKDRKGKVSYEKAQDLVTCSVGPGHAVTYRGFVELLRDIKISDVIKRPAVLSEWMDKGKMDQVWAVIGAMPDWYRSNESAQSRTDILDLVDHLEIDFAVAMIRMLLRRFDKLSGQFLKCNNKHVVAKIAKYL